LVCIGSEFCVPEIPTERALVETRGRGILDALGVNAVHEGLDDTLWMSLDLVNERLQPPVIGLRVGVQEDDHWTLGQRAPTHARHDETFTGRVADDPHLSS